MPPQGHIPIGERNKVRVRSQRACGPCRKRKIKCDGNDPCAACVGYGYDCVFTQRSPARVRSSTATAASPVRSNVSSNDARPSFSTPVTGRVTQPFMGLESLVPDARANAPLHQHIKTRFTSAYSAVAFPTRLGIKLGLPNAPRLQAFAWNAGMRAEKDYVPPKCLRDIISLDEMRHYSKKFFEEVNPFFGFLDRDIFTSRLGEFWALDHQGADFEACACGVFALGSYFSGGSSPSQYEAEVAEQGRLLLDMSVAYPPCMISVKHVAAWTLRAIYLRLTTRPHLSWMASCTSVHLAESIGLHREFNEIQRPRTVSRLEIELRRRTFWVTMCLHQFFSSEYGRSRVVLDSVVCQPITHQEGDSTSATLAILRSVPDQGHIGRPVELIEALLNATTLPAESPFLALLKADACFCIYRMLCSTNSRLHFEQITPLLETIRIALDAVAFLSSLSQAWWNIVGTPFHSICVLISIGSSESFDLLPSALQGLKNVTTKFNSHLSNEAIRTAHTLVQGTRDKRRQELDNLDKSLESFGSPVPVLESRYDPLLSGSEWPMEHDLGFQDYLDMTNYFNDERGF